MVNDTDGANVAAAFGSGKPSMMMLHAQHMRGRLGRPRWFFLHGFLAIAVDIGSRFGEQFHGCSRHHINTGTWRMLRLFRSADLPMSSELLRATLISYNALRFCWADTPWRPGGDDGSREGMQTQCGTVVETVIRGCKMNRRALKKTVLSDGRWAEAFSS